jgi:hypothetical protein
VVPAFGRSSPCQVHIIFVVPCYMIYIYSCYISGTSYQGLTFGNGFQEREDRLVYEPAKAFRGSVRGSESRGEEAAKLLHKFRINESSSPGVSEELALMALYRTGGDVLKADKQLQSLKQQRVSGADAADIAAHHRLDQAMVCVYVHTRILKCILYSGFTL